MVFVKAKNSSGYYNTELFGYIGIRSYDPKNPLNLKPRHQHLQKEIPPNLQHCVIGTIGIGGEFAQTITLSDDFPREDQAKKWLLAKSKEWGLELED